MNTHIQNALNGVLNNRKVLNVLIWTNIIRNFEIVNKRCKNGIFAANIPKVKITNIGKNAVNTKLTAEVPVKADLSANTTVTLAEDAKNSEITLSKKVDVEVKAADAEKAVEDVTINVAKEAEGASLKTEVKAEIKAEANVSITLDKTAQDSTVIVTDENVKVEVEKTDEDGNVSKEEITSTPIPAPDTTTPPSTGGNVQAPEAPKFSGTVNYAIGSETDSIKESGSITLKTTSGGAITFSLTENDAKNFTVKANVTTLTAKETDVVITVTATKDGSKVTEYTVKFILGNGGSATDPEEPDPKPPVTDPGDTDKTETIDVVLGGFVTVVSGDAITVSGTAVTVKVGNSTSNVTVTPASGSTTTLTGSVEVNCTSEKTTTVNFSGTVTVNGDSNVTASVSWTKTTDTIPEGTDKNTYTFTITLSKK